MKRITEAEWEVMETLWRSYPKSSTEVIQELAQTTGWAANTVRTLLSRLTNKGYLKVTKEAGKFLYAPGVTREECVTSEGRGFLERIFGGSSAPLLLHFAEKAELTPEELKSLEDVLKRKRKQK